MDLLIDWAYTHCLDDLSLDQAIALLEASHMYDMAELHGQCERVLSSCVASDTYHLLANVALRLHCQQLEQVCLADCLVCMLSTSTETQTPHKMLHD